MRLPVKQPVKLPTKLHPKWGEYIKRRSFRFNAGTIDYVNLSQPVTLAGDFEIALKFLPVLSRAHILANSSEDSSARLFYETESNKIELVTTAWAARFTVANPVLNKINSLRIGRVSGVWFCNLNGVEYSTEASFSAFTLDRIMSKWRVPTSVPNYAGVISDLRITSAGQLIHHWPMDESEGDIHYDTIGGNHGTIINPQPGDHERFEKVPGSGEWEGRQRYENPDFNNGSDGWTLQGSWSVQEGVLVRTPSAVSRDFYQSVCTPGYKYRATLSGIQTTQGVLRVFIDTGNLVIARHPFAGTAQIDFVTPRADPRFNATADDPVPFAGSIDSVQIRRILEIA